MTTLYPKKPCVRGLEMSDLCRFFLGIITTDLSLSDLCLGIEKNMFKEINAFYYVTYMITLYYMKPYPKVIQFTILVDRFLPIITI